MLIQRWDIDVDPTSDCRPTLRQHWTESKMMLNQCCVATLSQQIDDLSQRWANQ